MCTFLWYILFRVNSHSSYIQWVMRSLESHAFHRERGGGGDSIGFSCWAPYLMVAHGPSGCKQPQAGGREGTRLRPSDPRVSCHK